MSAIQEAPPTVLTPDTASSSPAGMPYLITADVFRKMLEAEVFADEDRVELWDGRIYEKMAKTQAHAVTGINVTMTLVRALPPGWCLSGENPIALGEKSTPLPDFAVLRGAGGDYLARRPNPADTGLIIELSLSSPKYDMGVKLAKHAEASIPAYWVLDLSENVVQVFERPIPTERRYESSQVFAVGQSVPLRLDGVLVAEIPAKDLLPVRG